MVACFAGKVLATTSEWLLNSLHFLMVIPHLLAAFQVSLLLH